MKTIIYRKSDLTCVGTVADNMTIKKELELNVIPNFGGKLSDYATIETDESYFRLELIEGEVTVVKNVVETPPILPTAEERLEALELAILDILSI